MIRAANLKIPAAEINFDTFLKCPKCRSSFTDSNPAYAIHECQHLYCGECVHFELESEICCYKCQAAMSVAEFHRKLPEWARLEIVKKYCRLNVESELNRKKVRTVSPNPEATQCGKPSRLLQFDEDEEEDRGIAADVSVMSIGMKQNLNKPTKKFGETPFHTEREGYKYYNI